jgi:hypothetical protein
MGTYSLVLAGRKAPMPVRTSASMDNGAEFASICIHLSPAYLGEGGCGGAAGRYRLHNEVEGVQ